MMPFMPGMACKKGLLPYPQPKVSQLPMCSIQISLNPQDVLKKWALMNGSLDFRVRYRKKKSTLLC